MAKTRFGSLDGVHKIKKVGIFGSMGISVLIFVVVLILFLLGVSLASRTSSEEQKKSLTSAIDRAMLQCYVTEGRYPDTMKYLEEKYGIYYDTSRFRVDYIVYGSNMKPDVTIVELEAE